MPRFVACTALFALSCLLVAQRPAPVSAQPKNDAAVLEKQVASLKQDLTVAVTLVNALKADLVQSANTITALKTANAKLQADNNQLAAQLKKGKEGDAKDEKALKGLQATIDGFRKAGLVHVVVLKLKADAPAAEAQSVIDDTYAQLAKIKTVRGAWAGKPVAAEKGTPDAASDYTVALVLVFDDAAGLRAYLKDPAHDKFAEKHLKLWESPLVYDFEPKKAAP